MTQIPAAQAVIELDKLLSDAVQGEEIVIIGNDGNAVKLVALTHAPKPVYGSAQGLVHIGPDFDESVDGFEEYMP